MENASYNFCKERLKKVFGISDFNAINDKLAIVLIFHIFTIDAALPTNIVE